MGKWVRETGQKFMHFLNSEKKEKVKTSWFFCRQLFCDFGEEFEVLDRDGEPPVSAMIQHISKVMPSVHLSTPYPFMPS